MSGLKHAPVWSTKLLFTSTLEGLMLPEVSALLMYSTATLQPITVAPAFIG
jgi:hypothetical protein